MSDIFTPFEPTPLVSEAPAAKPAKKPKAAKTPKRERKVASVNVLADAVPAGAVAAGHAAVAQSAKKPRKKRTVPKVRVPKSIKLPVNQMLLAMAELNASDGALFEKLLGLLTAAGKGQRQRVLAALGKVF